MNTNMSAVAKEVLSDQATSAELPKILLIDDDPIFCRAMERLTRRHGINLTCFTSTEEFLEESYRHFDIAVIDYDLVTMTGVEVAEYLQKTSWLTSVILTSGSFRRQTEDAPWPTSVKGFVHKGAGTNAVLWAALGLRGPKWAS